MANPHRANTWWGFVVSFCTEGRLITKNNKKEAGHPPCPAFGMVFALSFSVVSGFGIATFLR